MAKTSKKTTNSAKTAKKAKANAKANARTKMGGEGYKGHRPGSLKEKLHQIFDKHGAEKGRPLALKLDVEPSTVTTSFSQFRRGVTR
jgi:hypothetical protein